MPFLSNPLCQTTPRLLYTGRNTLTAGQAEQSQRTMKTGRGFAPLHELVKIVRIRRPEHRTHHSQHHGHPWCPMAPMHQPAHMPCLRCWWLPLPDAALSMGHEHGWVSWVGSPQQRCCPDAGSIFTGTAASILGVWRTRHVSCQMTMAGCTCSRRRELRQHRASQTNGNQQLPSAGGIRRMLRTCRTPTTPCAAPR